ncbi:MAG: IS30 family transposase, partial [Enterococcus faecalis]
MDSLHSTMNQHVKGKQKRYKADQGQSVYQINRRHCGRKSDFLKKAGFINYVIKHFFEDGIR